MNYLITICRENGCKRMRLLENECKYLKCAIGEYKMNKMQNIAIRNHLYNKLKSIINKYKINQYRINKISCQQIENQIVNCYIHLKSI